MKKFLIIALSTIIIIGQTNSQVLKYSNDYLNIGVSAKNISLGNSVTANVNDYSSGYYNPAGLADLETNYQVFLMHSEYFAGIAKYDYIGFSYKLDESTGLSASLIRLGVDDIQNTLYLIDNDGNVDYDRIELFSVADYAFLASYGRKTNITGLNYGITAKIIYRHQGEFANAYGFSIDAGMQYELKKWKFGANLNNSTTGFTAWFNNITEQMRQVFEETGNEIPHNYIEIAMPVLNTGVSRYFKFSDKTGLNSEFDLIFTFDGERNALISFNPISLYPQAGLEFNYKKTLFLRTGANNFQLFPDFRRNVDENYYRENSLDFVPAIGLGLIFHNFHIDYAFTDVADQAISLYSHIFSVGYRF